MPYKKNVKNKEKIPRKPSDHWPNGKLGRVGQKGNRIMRSQAAGNDGGKIVEGREIDRASVQHSKLSKRKKIMWYCNCN